MGFNLEFKGLKTVITPHPETYKYTRLCAGKDSVQLASTVL
jgi:hypothetical protein